MFTVQLEVRLIIIMITIQGIPSYDVICNVSALLVLNLFSNASYFIRMLDDVRQARCLSVRQVKLSLKT